MADEFAQHGADMHFIGPQPNQSKKVLQNWEAKELASLWKQIYSDLAQKQLTQYINSSKTVIKDFLGKHERKRMGKADQDFANRELRQPKAYTLCVRIIRPAKVSISKAGDSKG